MAFVLNKNISDGEEAALVWLAAQWSAELTAAAKQTDPQAADVVKTPEQYLRHIVEGVLDDYRKQFRASKQATNLVEIEAALPDASPAQMAQIKTVLGL